MAINVNGGTLDRPMHRLKPAEHAAMGWAHGQYRDGYCLALMAEDTQDSVVNFIQEASERDAVYVALYGLPEYAARTGGDA